MNKLWWVKEKRPPLVSYRAGPRGSGGLCGDPWWSPQLPCLASLPQLRVVPYTKSQQRAEIPHKSILLILCGRSPLVVSFSETLQSTWRTHLAIGLARVKSLGHWIVYRSLVGVFLVCSRSIEIHKLLPSELLEKSYHKRQGCLLSLTLLVGTA